MSKATKLEHLLTPETALKAVVVIASLKRPGLPLLDQGPEVAGDWMTDVLQVVKGGRNGMWYGARIRFVHSVVMCLLFSRDSFARNVEKVLKNSWVHAKNLGGFAFLFKLMLVALRRLSGARKHWHSAVAGLVGGSYVWGTDDPIAVQINLYLLSRVLMGSLKIAAANLDISPNKEELARNYKIFGSAVWMVVMYLFYNYPLKLQSSLTASMVEIYKNSDSIGPGSVQP
eukprot:Rhum_TRINITY_DN647_c0_g1::Rhum_TRINITY_DN647_c0_g1_i1::g.2048::m.2048/K13350/PXMP4, PMP24; peroxisomal membrane protein 4